jgi:hypothetical protein
MKRAGWELVSREPADETLLVMEVILTFRRTARSRGGAAKAVSQCARSASELVRQLRPNPTKLVGIASYEGHEIKLGGDTGEGCG